MHRVGHVAPIVVLCVLALLRGLLIAGLVPPLHGTDEPAHFDYAQRIAETGRLPDLRVHCAVLSPEVRELRRAFVDGIAFHAERPVPPLQAFMPPDPRDPSSRATTGCGPDALYPPLYFATAALGYRALLDSAVVRRLFAARLVSAAWGALAVAFAYLLGAAWFGARRDAILLALVFLVHPEMTFLDGVVTNDAALFACSTAAVAALAWLRRTRSTAALVMLAAAALAGALVKPTMMLLVPPLFVCAAAALGPRRLFSWCAAAAAVAPGAAAGLAWSIHDQPAMDDMISHAAQPLLPAAAYLRTQVFDAARVASWFRQYWSVWGWMDTGVREGYYRAILLCVLAAAAGIALGWNQLRSDDRRAVALTVGATAFVGGALLLIDRDVLAWQGMQFIQGRYFLPLFPFHAAAIFAGLRALGRWGGARLDGAACLPALLAVVDGAALLSGLARWYG